MSVHHVFLIALLLALIPQSFFWRNVQFLDRDDWIELAQYVATGDERFKTLPTYAYPGGPPLLLASIAHHVVGIPLSQSYPGSLAVISAVAIALVGTICYALRPQSWWWLVVIAGLSLHRLYFRATPPSALIAPLYTALMLLLAYCYEHQGNSKQKTYVLFGVIGGLALATRFDISLLVIGLLVWPITQLFRPRQVVAMVVSLVTTTILTNPFMWLAPLDHLLAFFNTAFYLYGHHAPSPFSFFQLGIASAFSLVSLVLVAALLATRQPLPLPRKFFSLNLLMTFIVSIFFLSATYKAVWYWLPLIFLWETLLPLVVLHLGQQLAAVRRWDQRVWEGVHSLAFIALYVGLLLEQYRLMVF